MLFFGRWYQVIERSKESKQMKQRRKIVGQPTARPFWIVNTKVARRLHSSGWPSLPLLLLLLLHNVNYYIPIPREWAAPVYLMYTHTVRLMRALSLAKRKFFFDCYIWLDGLSFDTSTPGLCVCLYRCDGHINSNRRNGKVSIVSVKSKGTKWDERDKFQILGK